MAGSTYGTLFKITTWGESHGAAIGVVIDGCPAGLSLCETDIQSFLDRRKPDRAVILQNGMKEIKSRFYLVSLRGRPQGLPFLLSFEMKTRFPGITAILRIAIVPGTLTIPSLKNMASGITEAADALPDVRPSAE